jgi:capsular polysaccharide transport system permease protein
VVTQFIASREMADLLDERIGLRKRFDHDGVDPFSAMRRGASEEEFATYWQTMVDPYFDLTTGSIRVIVRAFTPQDSLDIANAVIAIARKRVSDLFDQSRSNVLLASEVDVRGAEMRVLETRKKLETLRQAEHVYDPQQRVAAVSLTGDKLREDMTMQEAMLRQLQAGNVDPSLPAAVVIKSRIEADKAQLDKLQASITGSAFEASSSANASQKASGAGPKNAPELNAVVTRFLEAQSEEEFAEKAYQNAMAELDTEKSMIAREQLFLVNFVQPQLPQMSNYPNRWRSIAVAAAFALLIWAIAALVLQSIRDHVA